MTKEEIISEYFRRLASIPSPARRAAARKAGKYPCKFVQRGRPFSCPVHERPMLRFKDHHYCPECGKNYVAIGEGRKRRIVAKAS
jgi:hypothetical protein